MNMKGPTGDGVVEDIVKEACGGEDASKQLGVPGEMGVNNFQARVDDEEIIEVVSTRQRPLTEQKPDLNQNTLSSDEKTCTRPSPPCARQEPKLTIQTTQVHGRSETIVSFRDFFSKVYIECPPDEFYKEEFNRQRVCAGCRARTVEVELHWSPTKAISRRIGFCGGGPRSFTTPSLPCNNGR